MRDDKTTYVAWRFQNDLDDDTSKSRHRFDQKSETNGHKKKKVIEIGCGGGGFSSYLATLAEGQAPNMSLIAHRQIWTVQSAGIRLIVFHGTMKKSRQ